MITGMTTSAERTQWREWVFLAFLALGVRLLAASVIDGWRHPQMYEYETVVQSLLAGRGFSEGVYRSPMEPLYPIVCAVVYAMTGGCVAAVVLLQMLLGAATAILVGVMGQRVFGRTAGRIGGLLAACHPGLIIYASAKAHSLTFDAFLFLLAVWQIYRMREDQTTRRAAWAGLVLGIGILSRATAIVLLPVGLVWLLMIRPRPARLMEFKRWVLMAACAGVVITPWLVREVIVHHRFVFIRSTSWEMFWRGNNPQATGGSQLDATHTIYDRLSPEDLAEVQRLPDEDQQARWFRDRAFQFIRANPWGFVHLTAKKFRKFWWFTSETGLLYPRLWLRAYQGFYALIVFCALVGCWTVIRQGSAHQRQALQLIGGSLFILSLGQSFYYVEGRHRWAVEPLVLVIAAAGASTLISRVRAFLSGAARVEENSLAAR